METPFTQANFRPEAAFTAAAERFFELLKSFGMPAAAPGATRDFSAMAGPLASQFEQWLKASQSAAPWFAAAAPGLGAAFGAPAAGAFAPLPLGAGAAPPGEAQRSFELLTRLGQLQSQLAAYWSEIATNAAQRFVARLGSSGAATPTLESALKLYELWVKCAEESYAATVHKEEFGRLQAQLANTSTALLVEQRRHGESLARAFGLPSRSEVDALNAQLKELRARLAELAPEAPARPAPAGRTRARAAGKSRPRRRKRRG